MQPSPLTADQAKAQMLMRSTDMEPVQGTVDLDVPIGTLWECFRRANYWPRWNKCFFATHNRDLVIGRHLLWAFQPIKPWYLYKLWSIANIVEVVPRSKVTWEVTAFPGMYARHTYHMEDLGNGRTRFGSWEQATGWGFRIIRKFWIAHFTFVKDRSLEGALALNAHYKNTRQLDPDTLPKKSYLLFWIVTILVLLALAALIGGGWFFNTYVRESAETLAPGIHAVFGGGGNSLVVEDGTDVLLVDTKFPPGSTMLRSWIGHNVAHPVRRVVNTHYHYDHTQGNQLYPGAEIIAHQRVPELMRTCDGDWWSSHSGIPTRLVPDSGMTLEVGSTPVVLRYPAQPAHTSGDLYVYLPKANIVATGDLVFHTYYPFMDQPEGGTSIPGIIAAVRRLAADYPAARFLPGHGPMATSAELLGYANYLEQLSDAVRRELAARHSESAAVRNVDLTSSGLSILPSFHRNRMIWATSTNNVRWAYQILSSSGGNAI